MDAQIITAALGAIVTAGAVVLAADRLRKTLRPTGAHRGTDPMTHLAELLATGQLDANDFGWCPECKRRTLHAYHPDNSRTCWTCRTLTPAGASQ
jgi:gas vesicle protein